MRDVGHVRDGSPPQRNVVRVDGAPRGADDRAEERLGLDPGDRRRGQGDAAAAAGRRCRRPARSLPLDDQSLFVKAAVSGVVKEGVIAAALTSLMILLFLGSWRSTVIIAISIPLAVLSSIAAAVGAGPDAEHHDPGRPGAGGRHPGRRRHGDHREHQLAPGAGQGRAHGHPRRRRSRS